MLKRLLWITLLLLGLGVISLSAPTPAVAQDDTLDQTEINRIIESVVLIVAEQNGTPFSTGSGTVVTADGLIYTNAHVVEDGDDYQILFQREVGELPQLEYYASVVRVFDEVDLAILQIDRDARGRGINIDSLDLPFLDQGTNDVTFGQRIWVFGYPGIADGFLVVTQGTITSIENADINGQRIPFWYRTDAEMSPGNSGGLAVNSAGQFVGIPTAVWKEDRTAGRLGGILPWTAIQTVVGTEDNSPVVEADDATLTIANNTETSICYVFFSPVTSTDWGDDQLNSDEVIRAGDDRTWSTAEGTYDVLMQDCNRETVEDVRSVDINGTTLVTAPYDPAVVETPDRDLFIEIIGIEHNVPLEDGDGRLGMRVITRIEATGYRGVPLRVGMFYYWADGDAITGENALPGDRTADGLLTVQTLLEPTYDSTEWEEYWFWMPYSSFPGGRTGEQEAFAQAMIGVDGDTFEVESNPIDFVLNY